MTAQLPVPAPQDSDEQASKNAAVIAQVADAVLSIPRVDSALFIGEIDNYFSSLKYIVDTVTPTLKFLDAFKPTYLHTIAEFTSPRWMNVMKDMLDSRNRAMKSAMDILDSPSFMSTVRPEYDIPVIDLPPPRGDIYETHETHIHETHLTINIQAINLNMDEAEQTDQPVPLPDAGCLRLDTFIALKHEGDDQGTWYLKSGEWNFVHLPPLAVNILLYLYQMRLYPERYAHRVKDIAVSMNRKPESISRELRRIEDLCKEHDIKPLLAQTAEQRWCLSWQLTCCRHLWS